MQLNYFGCLRVTMGLLPGDGREEEGPHRQHQLDRRADQCAALLGLRRAARRRSTPGRAARSSEYADKGITFTTINMPLVRTPMIAPTGIYANAPDALARGSRRHGRAGLRRAAGAHRDASGRRRPSCCTRCMPRVAQIVMNTSFRMFPESAAAKGEKGAKPHALGRGGGDAADDARHPFLRPDNGGIGAGAAPEGAGRYAGRPSAADGRLSVSRQPRQQRRCAPGRIRRAGGCSRRASARARWTCRTPRSRPAPGTCCGCPGWRGC